MLRPCTIGIPVIAHLVGQTSLAEDGLGVAEGLFSSDMFGWQLGCSARPTASRPRIHRVLQQRDGDDREQGKRRKQWCRAEAENRCPYSAIHQLTKHAPVPGRPGNKGDEGEDGFLQRIGEVTAR
jgi:hypothetical protein